MAKWESSEPIALVSEILKLVSGETGAFPIFRGHSAYGHEPMPKVLRPNVEGIRTGGDLLNFREIIRGSTAADLSRDITCLAFAQHVGIPTALLDWTSNPLVALYFATEGDGDGELIWMPKSLLVDLDPDRSLDALNSENEVRCCRPHGYFPRADAQGSILTFHSPHFFSDQRPWHFPEGTSYASERIRASDKLIIRAGLETMGFNARSVFPDLEGALMHFRATHLTRPKPVT